LVNGPRRGGWRPQLGWLALALAAATGGVVLWATAPGPAEPGGAPAPASPVVLPTAAPPSALVTAHRASAAVLLPLVAASSPAAQTTHAREPEGDLTPDISVFVNKGERPTMTEVIERLHQAWEYGGLGAFSPPGTRPPLIGLAVPEGFALPEGYVRHYQATDDGQRIEAILMFAPDRQFVDAAGNPVVIPADRVVPLEFAPPGLPIRRIEIPAPAPEPGK
jgi:hypothetical protein